MPRTTMQRGGALEAERQVQTFRFAQQFTIAPRSLPRR
jgi:hypothetical protein